MAIGNLKAENYIPVIRLNKGLKSAYPAAFGAGTTIGGSAVVALGTITSASANALAVGRQGTTGPAFNVDSSTSLQADGFNVQGLAAGNGVKVSTITTGTNAPLTIDSAGSGTITIGGTSTGAITLGRATTITTGNLTLTSGDLVVTANASKLSFTGTGANGGVLKNLKNAAQSSLSGTQKDIEIDIGGVAYYFTVYPTKA